MDLSRYLDIDLKKYLVLPAFTDIHVHTRNPGIEHIGNTVMAALKGGVTTLFAMPNTNPVMNNLELYNAITSLNLPIKIIQVVSLTKDGKPVEYSSFNTLFFSDDGRGVEDDALMEDICKQSTINKIFILQHPEYQKISKGDFPYSKDAEILMIERDINLSKKYQIRIHFQHLSCKESVELIRAAKKNGIMVTAEVTPHHLLFTSDDIRSPIFKTNPPIRSHEDREALVNGFNDATIDCLATDHAPHVNKNQSISTAPSGMIGMETAFAAVFTKLVKPGKITLERLVDAYAIKPREIFNLPVSNDQVVIDHTNYQKYELAGICTEGKNSPFIGEELTGFPLVTISNDKIAFIRNNNEG